jgi:hypothetical protein
MVRLRSAEVEEFFFAHHDIWRTREPENQKNKFSASEGTRM